MRLEQIKEGFDIDVGATMPTILSNEHQIYLIFYVRYIDPAWDGSTIHMRTENDEGIATVKFERFAQFKFGNPNDETISGHPLHKLGLQPFAIQKVSESEWIKELVELNSVQPYHEDKQFSNYKHFIFFFHDTCFEIIAEGYLNEQNPESNMKDEILRIGKLL